VKTPCTYFQRLQAALLLVLALAGCSSAPRPKHAPSAPPPVVAAIPSRPSDSAQGAELIPKAEPRSQRGNPPFYTVNGHRYTVLQTSTGFVERGVASWYGTDFHGLKTSTGEPYDMFAMTAAHKTLPLPCYARVTNLTNGRSVVVRINDRGPFVDNRIIDLSYAAAKRLDMIRNGTGFVQLEVLSPSGQSINASLPVNVPAASSAAAGVSSVPPVTIVTTVSGAGAASPDESPAPPTATSTPTPATPPTSTSTPTPAPTPAPAPAPAPTSTPTAQPVVPASSFYIQVGAYSKADNAASAARRIKAGGIEDVMTLPANPAQPLERVRVGPIHSVQQFDALFAKLNSLGFPNARLAQD
jgi:rare lipoprotein A